MSCYIRLPACQVRREESGLHSTFYIPGRKEESLVYSKFYIEIKCPSLAEIPHTILTNSDALESYPQGYEMVYGCIVGYEHKHGDARRSCQYDSTWSGTDIFCKRKPVIDQQVICLFLTT